MGYLFQHNVKILCYSVPQYQNTVTSDTSLIYILWTNLVTFFRRATWAVYYDCYIMIRITAIVYFLIVIGAKILLQKHPTCGSCVMTDWRGRNQACPAVWHIGNCSIMRIYILTRGAGHERGTVADATRKAWPVFWCSCH